LRYTTLRVTEAGIVLHDFHVERLAPEGPAGLAIFARFAREATPGVYGVALAGDELRAEQRSGSQLVEGMPVCLVVSPFAAQRGAFPKPGPPSAYDGVRIPGVATLLTSADGSEIHESCVAAVLGWDGTRFVGVPEDRPRVTSVAEAAVRASLPFARSPLRTDDCLPLILINAVAGPCSVSTGRPPVPAAAVMFLTQVMQRFTRRP
jgi:hypothetical protein